MMTDFKILDETTFGYKGGKLYLMLLRVEDKFAVEVVDRTQTFGRKLANSRLEAELLFDTLKDKLSTFKCFFKASETLSKYFAFNEVDKIVFLILTDKANLGQDDIIAAKKKVKFKLKVAISGESVKLDIFFSDKKKFTFSGTINNNDLVLEDSA